MRARRSRDWGGAIWRFMRVHAAFIAVRAVGWQIFSALSVWRAARCGRDVASRERPARSRARDGPAGAGRVLPQPTLGTCAAPPLNPRASTDCTERWFGTRPPPRRASLIPGERRRARSFHFQSPARAAPTPATPRAVRWRHARRARRPRAAVWLPQSKHSHAVCVCPCAGRPRRRRPSGRPGCI